MPPSSGGSVATARKSSVPQRFDDDDDVGFEDDRAPRPRGRFALVVIALLGVWKLYEALVAPTAREAIPPSLYTLGVATFAVSLRGPRRFQLATFFAAAVLCLGAIALESRF